MWHLPVKQNLVVTCSSKPYINGYVLFAQNFIAICRLYKSSWSSALWGRRASLLSTCQWMTRGQLGVKMDFMVSYFKFELVHGLPPAASGDSLTMVGQNDFVSLCPAVPIGGTVRSRSLAFPREQWSNGTMLPKREGHTQACSKRRRAAPRERAGSCAAATRAGAGGGAGGAGAATGAGAGAGPAPGELGGPRARRDLVVSPGPASSCWRGGTCASATGIPRAPARAPGPAPGPAPRARPGAPSAFARPRLPASASPSLPCVLLTRQPRSRLPLASRAAGPRLRRSPAAPESQTAPAYCSATSMSVLGLDFDLAALIFNRVVMARRSAA